MRRHPALSATILVGIFSIGTVGVAYTANDNSSNPAGKQATFDHKSLGKDVKDCAKCHKSPPPAKKK